MLVRLAKKSDVSKGLQMFDAINNEELFRIEELNKMGIIFDRSTAEDSMNTLVQANSVFVLDNIEMIVGVIGGMFMKSLFSKDIIYQTFLFYIKPEFRKFTARFISEVENFLKKTTATKLVISNLDVNEYIHMDRYYAMKGFNRLETHFVKSL